MHAAANLAKALATIVPSSFIGPVARRVGLAALLTPLKTGARIADLEFLFSSRRRNRFTPSNGRKCIRRFGKASGQKKGAAAAAPEARSEGLEIF